jgi:hypothetical protein
VRKAGCEHAEPAFIARYGNELHPRFGLSFSSTSETGAATGIEFLANGELQVVAEPVRRGGGAAAAVGRAAGHPLQVVAGRGVRTGAATIASSSSGRRCRCRRYVNIPG